jgi:regulator of sigma D
MNKSRLDEILAGFNSNPTSQTIENINPADEVIDTPSNFPEVVVIKPVALKDKDSLPLDYADDLEYTRTILRHVIDKGVHTLEGAINIAKETENARAIEVAGQLMNSISDMTTKLMKLHDKKISSQRDINNDAPLHATQNNIYVLDKGKNAKDVLNELLGKSININHE